MSSTQLIAILSNLRDRECPHSLQGKINKKTFPNPLPCQKLHCGKKK